MSKIQTIIRLIKTPGKLIQPLGNLGFFNWLPDKVYLQLLYHGQMGHRLNIDNPKTFNEKLQWLKLYNRKQVFETLVDKYEVKQYVASKIGEEYIIPTIGVWDKVDLIPFDALPEKFVMKCTHDSGSVIICRDKDKFDINKTKRKLKGRLKKNSYWFGREWPYKNVKPRIIAEKYLENEDSNLIDYKIHVFNGTPKFILVCCDRFKESGLTDDFYTTDWIHMDIQRPGHPNASGEIKRPTELEKMLELAKELAGNIPFVRVDFYIVDGHIFFGEMTFFPTSGLSAFIPEKWDDIFGSWLHLPDKC